VAESIGDTPSDAASRRQTLATATLAHAAANPTHLALVTLAAYHISVALTPRTSGRFKRNIAARSPNCAQTNGQVESGPIRVNLRVYPATASGHRPAHRMAQQSRAASCSCSAEDRDFLNGVPQNGPVGGEIESGCDQVTQSFRLGS